jgi:hypothetical protein
VLNQALHNLAFACPFGKLLENGSEFGPVVAKGAQFFRGEALDEQGTDVF